MNVAQTRPRTWSPQIIVFSIVLHAVVIYYIASAFNIVPPIIPVHDERPTPIMTFPPPPPPPPEPDRLIKTPRVIPRQPLTSPVTPSVPPLPIPAQPPAVSTADATVIAVNTPIPEQPIVQPLPAYPHIAQMRDIEGRVVLSITIMPDGTVRDVQVVSAQPRGYFEDAALRAVRTWRYRPSNVIRTKVIVDMDFVLRG